MSHAQLSFTLPGNWSKIVPSVLLPVALLALCLWLLSDSTAPQSIENKESVLAIPADSSDAESNEELTSWAVASEKDIPFPLYPNATRYRIGGQNGLKLALFETTDEFGDVDHFYAENATSSGLSRQLIMSDYVQYGSAEVATPTKAADTPNILIYAFFDAKEAQKAGATADARTSIIISYR